MSKLIVAELRRALKSRVFRVLMGLTVFLSLLICFSNYRVENQNFEYRLYLEDIFFTFYQFTGFLSAAIISLVFGAEYSGGAIRNKVSVGYRRGSIYLSYFIVCAIMSLLIMLVHFVLTVSIGCVLYGCFRMSLLKMVYLIVCCFLNFLVFSAICFLILIICQSKAVAAVVSTGIVLGLIYVASFVGARLSEPEMYYNRTIVSQEGVIRYGDLVTNPAYVGGRLRTVLDFVYDLLPSGQLSQMFELELEGCEYWALMSVGLMLVVFGIGVYIFKKTDIK